MFYQTYDPPSVLAPYVRFFWAYECDATPDDKFVHRTLADCCVEMVFHYRESFDEITADGIVAASPWANIQAQSTEFRRFVTQRSFGIFGVYMYPFAIPRLFSISATELTNINPDLVSVIGKEAAILDERVAEAASNEERVAIVSEFLLSKLNTGRRELPPLHIAAKTIIDSQGAVSIEELAGEHGYSRRQFERKFKEFAGLSPKLFARVARFQSATQFKLDGCRDLTEIAYACGYYDQSHFINDFREFSGYTPSEYFWNIAEGTQYIDPEQMSHLSNSFPNGLR